MKKPCCISIHADGVLAWKSESKALQLSFRHVVHIKMQFSKLVKVRKLPKLTGTQTLDQARRQLKRVLPRSLRTRGGSGEKDDPRLEEYVWAFVFRFNHRDNLLADLAKICQNGKQKR